MFYDNALGGKTFAVWGLAFKPETDNIREAPALDVIEALSVEGAKVQAFNPEAIDNLKKKYSDQITYTDTMYKSLEGADGLVICTEWSIFRTPNFTKIREFLRIKLSLMEETYMIFMI